LTYESNNFYCLMRCDHVNQGWAVMMLVIADV